MDMDIPLPDELEWLEAHSRLHEEDPLDLQPPDPYLYPPIVDEEDEGEEGDSWGNRASPPPKSPPSVEEQLENHKRPSREEAASPIETKRKKVADHEDDGEEDWMRYSPPPETSHTELREEEILEPEEVAISRYASQIDGECVPVTAPGGDRVYAKICRFDIDSRPKKLDTRAQSDGLTTEPVNLLLQRCEKEAFTKVLLWLKQWDSCVFGSEIRSTTDEVLLALRRHFSDRQHRKYSSLNTLKSSRWQRWTKESFKDPHKSDHIDADPKGTPDTCSKSSRLTGPPEQKVLLLCGPPGLGKTTLAHVAAKHCGYRVVEINASDDRSSATVEAKILDVVQMDSVMADSKPKCLIIDEIDGALGDGKGAVEVILKLVSAGRKFEEGKQNAAKEEQSGKISKKRQKTPSLLRPVICICNDLYAPALRQLRQIAKVHIFVQPSISRIVSRLKYICSKEGMKASSIALTALAEYTECDIRSCLNTLQFLNKKKETLNVVDISSQVVGRKDVSRSIFDIWKEIFQKRKNKRDRKSSIASSLSSEFDALHSLISSRGDYDLVLEGIHENILHLHYHDPVMWKTVACLDSIGVSDLIHQYIFRSQQMHLQVYQPSIAIAVHRHVAQVQKANIEWPKSYHRCRTMLIERADTLRDWCRRIPPHLLRHLSIKSVIEDSVSPLLHILSPPNLRPVAMHLLSEKEKNDLNRLVSTMVSYSITYKNANSCPPGNLKEEAISDSSSLGFDPPIHDYVNFKDYKSSHHILPAAMKQVLVHEVEKQKILHGCTGKSVSQHIEGEKTGGAIYNSLNAATCAMKDIDSGAIISGSTQFNASASTNFSSLAHNRATTVVAKLKPTNDSKKLSAGRGFFDRFRKLKADGSETSDNAAQKATTLKRDSYPLLFKFNEGFTNAIKRPVRIRDFLL
ncbi:chromosome transmission fidelity protein 18 homolog isoform X3 [Rhodamnia argentea]|uniref:Chromosome transmission fidelity protein 18 homolog isoform X3 n=1 Tax=Rhodamnia argentea TaxID=178133 RepID=A0ABM3GYF8_9MYRT|nr:chromosome transmission fidelity protein 18 homolog isoform X3 [Rhodamnia argentea]